MNEQIELLRQSIIKIINDSKLPIGVVNLIIKELSSDLDVTYHQVVAKERQQRLEAEQTQDKEAGE